MSGTQHIHNHRAERYYFQRRVYLAGIIILLLAVGLFSRLYWLQVQRHSYYSTRAEDNRLRVEVVPPTRGLIFDRNGVILAENLPSFSLQVVPNKVEDVDATLDALSQVVHIDAQDRERFKRDLRSSPGFRPVTLRQQLSSEEVASFEVERHRFPGVSVQATLIRHYPFGPAMSHVIGYVSAITEKELSNYDKSLYRGTTHTGKTGVERSYEHALHGVPGYRIVETNARGVPLRQVEFKPPTPGKNLILTLDARLQQTAYDALAPHAGSVVAIQPQTGEVLVMVSRPGFDTNQFVTGISYKAYKALRKNPYKPLYNRSIQGIYPPGSIVKPMFGLGGLNDGVITPESTYYCPGYFQLNGKGRHYRCWKRSGHGALNVASAIVQSCDVFFYNLAADTGIDKMHDWMVHFGLGKPTGIDLPSEYSGIAPSTDWKHEAMNERWYPGETLSVGIGQGYMSLTPLQAAQMATVLASRGHAYKPHVLLAQTDGVHPQRDYYAPQAEPVLKLKDPSEWEVVIQAMRKVIFGRHGTAWRIERGLHGYDIAGKTGTAQVRGIPQGTWIDTADLEGFAKDHAWFIAFAPVKHPSIAIAVLAEHAGHGGAESAPVARKVFDAWILPKLLTTEVPSAIVGHPPERPVPVAADNRSPP